MKKNKVSIDRFINFVAKCSYEGLGKTLDNLYTNKADQIYIDIVEMELDYRSKNF